MIICFLGLFQVADNRLEDSTILEMYAQASSKAVQPKVPTKDIRKTLRPESLERHSGFSNIIYNIISAD